MFSKYYYLNHFKPPGNDYVAFYNNTPVAFCSIQHFPHPRAKNIKRITRLVTMPDYQGIGIGVKLLDWVANYYTKLNSRVRIVTSTPSLAYSLKYNIHWQLKRQGRVGSGSGSGSVHNKHNLTRTNGTYRTYRTSVNRITTAWEYKL